MKVINKNDAGREQEIQMEKPIRGKVPKSQAGAIEMSAMIVLLVVLILGAGAFFAWPNISYRLDKGSFNQQLSLIQQAATDYKSSASVYTGISLTELCNKNLVKGELCTVGTTPWGGKWTVAADTDPSKMALTADVKDSKTAANLKLDMDRIDGWTTTVTGTAVKMVR
ncbi:TPA: hypothetical protein ACSCX2_004248 [Aeromonas veronii]|uniref:hypothetical protein n=1 Tax=Aeromonas genomosp. paramedia TaxID=3086176 RepID=UPI001FFC5D08|nr:hypothetical protein [Aeromonas genomosp. paramedia]MCK2086483.1 hypothetical protein [Aeromonas genomosp. paramedia]